jgi:cytochrome c556
MSKYLSKSTFIRSLQCQKSLYLYKKHYELRDPVSQEQQAVFSRGHEVGRLAQMLFPKGIDVGWKSPRQFRKSVDKTAKLIQAGQAVIYEAAFLWDDVLVALDILVKKEDGWHAYEVKSSTQVSETYLRDAALQYYVINQSGLRLKSISVIHLNKHYTRSRKLLLKELFTTQDITEQVKAMQPYIAERLKQAKETLRNSMPSVDIGPHCHSPYPCDFQNYCWNGHNTTDSIFALTELEEDRKWLLHQKGIHMLKDIPEEFPLTRLQRIQRDSLLGQAVHIDRAGLLQWINAIKFPAAFLEFGVVRAAIPHIEGTRPYQNVPFGYGLHTMSHICSEIDSSTFLSEAGQSLQEQFIRRFLKDTEGLRQIVVFDKPYEIKIFRQLAELYPEYASALQDRAAKFKDMAELLQRKHFYHPGIAAIDQPTQFAAAIGIEADHSNPISSSYMAGVGFEQLFEQIDFIALAEVRNLLTDYLQLQSSMLVKTFMVLREECMQEA